MMMLVSTMLRSLSTSSGNLRSSQRSTPAPSPSSGGHRLQPAQDPPLVALNWPLVSRHSRRARLRKRASNPCLNEVYAGTDADNREESDDFCARCQTDERRHA